MWQVSARFLPALTRSHGMTLRAEAWYGDTLVATIPVGDGGITATARNRIRRTLDLTVPEYLYPADPGDALTPFGAELRIWRGIDYGDSREEIPVFQGRVDEGDGRRRFGGQVAISGTDPGSTLNDARFETPRAAPAGWSITATIRQLILEADPGTSVSSTVTVDGRVPAGLSWDRDRGQAVDDLAKAIGADVWAGPDGVWHITPQPTLTDPAVWTLTDGVDGCVVEDSQKVSRAGVYSVIVVIAERADGTTPLRLVVADTDPTSPTYVGGPFGRVPRFYSSPLLSTTTQMRAAGAALLAKSTGLTRTRAITCVPNPALEVGDRIDISVGGETEQHIVDDFRLPLAADGTMSITTRAAKPDAGDLTDS